MWLKEEESERKEQQDADSYHDIMKIQERVFETVTAIQKKGQLSLAQIAEKIGRTEDELKQYMNSYKILYAVENNLNYILREIQNDK